MKLTDHFSLEEFERSSTATANHIDNHVPEALIPSLRNLCEQVLEPLRQWYGKPITISSGYRCQALNSHPNVRGAKNSHHMKGEAADLRIPFVKAPNESLIQDMPTARKWIEFILDETSFDHLILEHDKTGHYWIHVSCKISGNRQTYTPNLLKQ